MFPSQARNSGPESHLSQRAAAFVDFTAMHNSEFQELPLHAEDRPQEECGVFGIYAPGVDVARRTFFGIFALQHRGQESAGIAVSDGNIKVAYATWAWFRRSSIEDTLDELTGDIAVGHTRYSTTGSSRAVQRAADYDQFARWRNGAGAQRQPGQRRRLCAKNWKREGVQFSTSMDTEVIAQVLSNRAAIARLKKRSSK